jgi:hypothetical protein
MIRVAHPESQIWNLTFTRPGSRGQKRTGSRIRIRNTASRCSHSAANVPPRLTPDIFFIKTKRFLLIVSLAFLLLFLERFFLIVSLDFLLLLLEKFLLLILLGSCLPLSSDSPYLPPFQVRFSLHNSSCLPPSLLERFPLLVQLSFFLFF